MIDPALLQIPKFTRWHQRLLHAGCTVHDVTELHAITKKNSNSLLFGLYRIRATDSDGDPLLPIVLIRGDAVVIVVRLDFAHSSKYLMVRQRRVGSGLDSLEFPAGMVDENINDPLSVAITELEEETGLYLTPDRLQPLFDKELYSSVGLSDEAIHYFGATVRLTPEQAKNFEGRLRVNANEEEKIRVVLSDRQTIISEATSLQTILGLYLFENLEQMRSAKMSV